MLPPPPPPAPRAHVHTHTRSTGGISTDVEFRNVRVLDSKHVGVQVLRSGGFADPAEFNWRGGLLVGQSSPDVCAACAKLSDPGCHKKLTRVSYNRAMPFTPAIGFQQARFGVSFEPGPEFKPWDEGGIPTVLGKATVTGVTVADFLGPNGCGGSNTGTYALVNHPGAPDAFHPHFFSRMTVVNVPSG